MKKEKVFPIVSAFPDEYNINADVDGELTLLPMFALDSTAAKISGQEMSTTYKQCQPAEKFNLIVRQR
ncbi:hypothetical protein KIN20_004759 [Parelaphostrongylus tenuis]|uniref:Uncharacterized protein n=1 Tax=Parelaphostrongylus tenuis TaxID=148309 RepID=A0AAD5LZB6_PARTN|nr:hypothetical protein KIN20_004759 [Parelaphostrongylus tenuis]